MFSFSKSKNKDDLADIAISGVHSPKELSEIIINSIDDGVVLVNQKKQIGAFNPAAEKITGWKAGDAKGLEYKSIFKLVDAKGEEIRSAEDPFIKSLEEGKAIRDNNLFLVTADNKKTISLAIGVSPLKDKDGKVVAVVAVFMDITEEKKAESQRAEFISTASHEMRTPVAAIEGYLALAMNEKVCKIDSKAREYLERAHSSTEHLGKLFQDLLTSAKAEDGRLVNHPQPVEMGEYLEQLADSMRFTASKKNLQLEYHIGASDQGGHNQKQIRPLYYANVDPDRIREVITNLFDNAIKYTEYGKIVIGITGDDNVVQIYVKDSGQGIPKDDLPHLFEKFYRVDNSATRAIGGTGLGLFICRKIIELYNGRIWAESKMEEGSTFYINLPRISAEKATSLTAELSNQTKPIN